MFVIDVVPFSRNAPAGALSYRSRDRAAIGTIVHVPLRRQEVPAIVVACTPAREAKAALKAASFTLRGATPRKIGALPNAYVRALADTATYHGVPLGIVCRTVLPEAVIQQGFGRPFTNGPGTSTTYLEQPSTHRLQAYEELIRAEDAKATLIIAPTLIEATRLGAHFGKSAVVLHSGITGTRRMKAFAAAWDAPIVVATPTYAFVPIRRLTHIILERESAGSYVSMGRNAIDFRVAIQALAESRHVPVMAGDFPLRLEIRPQPSAPVAGLPSRGVEILDTRPQKDAPQKTFAAVAAPLLHALDKTVQTGGRAVVLAARRGYAPAIVCCDCGTTVRDTQGRALSLATIRGTRVLRSADGTIMRDAKALCDVCGSWNLLPLGVGVERVADELTQNLPAAHIIRFDADTIKTPAAARKALAAFAEPSSILVGTESVLPWLDPDIVLPLVAIASADSLLAMPFWRSRERLLRIAMLLAERANRLLVATRRPDDTVFTTLQHGSDDFFVEEAALRKTLHYPPYSHLIVLRMEGTHDRVAHDEEHIRTLIERFPVTTLPDKQLSANTIQRTLVLRTTSNQWPDKKIAAVLEQIPSHITRAVDPESFW